MTRMHSTQTKKSYKKPVLNEIGKVSKLTRELKGSTSTDGSGFVTIIP
ncbi:lasso RiPP family leader peptide-containing protein [Dyadobacter frigoris]|uniref:Lasso RiPP family leader peptide-containing protein n=1 Tax=Dyadobacter frigoris TaxID=2576211 RepID=A0A4V6BJ93_9BACT|nr:lasso RiPP family leader peptide-containing protein [Dyadobacter frigoris]TKT93433.1 lasso RiPP family leader peptide-containing protein [Dyadobacter frigoris]